MPDYLDTILPNEERKLKRERYLPRLKAIVEVKRKSLPGALLQIRSADNTRTAEVLANSIRDDLAALEWALGELEGGE